MKGIGDGGSAPEDEPNEREHHFKHGDHLPLTVPRVRDPGGFPVNDDD